MSSFDDGRAPAAPTEVGGRGRSVVLVTPGFPPARGGVEEHTGRLAAAFVSAGLSVQVLTAARDHAGVTTKCRDGLSVTTFPAWRTSIMSVSPRLLRAALRSARTADVLHVHSYHAMNAAALLGRGRSTRVVFTPHYHGAGHTTAARGLHLLYRHLGRLMFRAADEVICVSGAEKDAVVADFPFVADRITVIPNGIDTRALAGARPFDGEPPTVLSLGRLESYKGVAGLLRAFRSVPIPAQLVVIGDGSERSSLEKLAAEMDLGNRVRFLGSVDTVEMHRWLSTAGVLVSLSEHEAFGMVPLEAAGAGARVVLSDIPAHREIARVFLHEAAVIVPARDETAVAGAIREQLVPAARVALALPDWTDVAARTISIYFPADIHSPAEIRSPGTAPARQTGRGRMKSSAPARSSMGRRGPAGRRIGVLDQPWQGHWSALAIAPVSVPTVPEMRSRMLRFIQTNPSAAYACLISPDNRRWLPVPADRREEHVRRMVVGSEDPDLDAMADFIERHRPPADLPHPLIVLGRESICLYQSHMFGDASFLSQIVLHLIVGDLDGVASMSATADMSAALRTLVRQPRSSYRAWAGLALRRSRPADHEAAGAVAHIPATRAEIGFAESVLSNTALRGITRWRNANARGVGLTSVLTAATYCALVREGVPMQITGHYGLFDLRRYLPDDVTKFGNLAKSVFLRANMTDPRAIGEAMDDVITSGRVIPATVIGGLMTAFGRAHGSQAESDGPVTLSFVSMPTLPGLADVPWVGTGRRRFVGLGYPGGRLSVSVFAVRLRDHMELGATFDRSVLDPGAVRRALDSISDPLVLSLLTPGPASTPSPTGGTAVESVATG